MADQIYNEIDIPEEFQDICPVQDKYFRQNMERLVAEPGFEHAVKYVVPNIDYRDFANQLLEIKNKYDFQHNVMCNILEILESKTTNGVSYSGIENISTDKAYTFISNHRDIVLDACFLNLSLIREKYNSTEIAIGNNLLILDWIETLVKINGSFIVKRNLPMRQALEAAKQLSGYLHFVINKKKNSLWIAQRQGRAKDSNDFTQEGLVKMMALDGEGTIIERLKDINLLPVTISYEYDPNDYLKAKEFLLKKKDPDYKKSPHDDLLGMEIGILGQKGRVHFAFSKCLNDILDKIELVDDKVETYKLVCAEIDKSIHINYRMYPHNYVAYDMFHNTNRFVDKYTAEEKSAFEEYVDGQIAKIDVPLDAEDRAYVKEMILKMYFNPLVNQLKALGEEA